MAEVQIYNESELTDEQIAAVVTLTNSVWPKEELTLEQRIEQTTALIRSPERPGIHPLRFVVWDNESAIAHALVFERVVHVLDDNDKPIQSINVLALAAVCTDHNHRGAGLGVAVAKAAFGQISDRRPVSLFQTGVPKFYEKLGGRIVSNPFVNLLNEENSQANPWWDVEVMIVPGSFGWPDGKIDMNGAGY